MEIKKTTALYCLTLSMMFFGILLSVEAEEIYSKKSTLLGSMIVTKGMDRIYLDGKLLVESKEPFTLSVIDFEHRKIDSKFVREKVLVMEHGGAYCPTRYHILDFSGPEPIVSNPFDNGNCSEYDWVSWGKKNSVITLKDGAKFVYENGKVRRIK